LEPLLPFDPADPERELPPEPLEPLLPFDPADPERELPPEPLEPLLPFDPCEPLEADDPPPGQEIGHITFGSQQLHPLEGQQSGCSPSPQTGGFALQRPLLDWMELWSDDRDEETDDLLDDPHGHWRENEILGSMYPPSGRTLIEIVWSPSDTSVGPHVYVRCGRKKQSTSLLPSALKLIVEGNPPFVIATVVVRKYPPTVADSLQPGRGALNEIVDVLVAEQLKGEISVVDWLPLQSYLPSSMHLVL
jgi:hypothetical protein